MRELDEYRLTEASLMILETSLATPFVSISEVFPDLTAWVVLNRTSAKR